MHIAIRHETTYRYAQVVTAGVQYLRLTPQNTASQQVLRWAVRGPGQPVPWRDEHGNSCHSVTLAGVRQAITVIAEGELETRSTDGVLPMDEGRDLPTGAYLRQTPPTAPSAEMIAFAEGHRRAIEADQIAGSHELMMAIRGTVAYEEDTTEVDTTAAEAFATATGVCQDHAHIFLGCARHLRLPARYVSGYLASQDGGPGLHAASHAWVEAQVPGLGWVSFDPANGVSADEHYVRLAVGLDYNKAAPIRGIRHGGAGEALEVSVQIQGQQ